MDPAAIEVADIDVRIWLPGLAVFAGLLYTISRLVTATDVPKIRGIFEIPHAWPIVGHLLQLGDDHATVCERWWLSYKRDVFQIRLGNTRQSHVCPSRHPYG